MRKIEKKVLLKHLNFPHFRKTCVKFEIPLNHQPSSL